MDVLLALDVWVWLFILVVLWLVGAVWYIYAVSEAAERGAKAGAKRKSNER